MSMMWFFSQPMAMEIGKRGQDEVLLLWQQYFICGDLNMAASLTCALDLQHFYILLLAIVLVGLTSVIWACFSPGH
jgi:hypothetical protein